MGGSPPARGNCFCPGAAGYGDFMNQLHHNAAGIQFYTCLFPAVMQGANTVPSVMAALARVEKHKELFDCVVVIRGGGSTSDLNSFDNYDLAAAIACFPLPVIVGIGHDRDNTVVDEVANVRGEDADGGGRVADCKNAERA